MRLLFAKSMTRFFRLVADTFFAKRYGHRAVVLETVAGVPGMVAGMLLHFQSLRKMKTGYGEDIREMLAEAENERMHLMFFIEIAKPNLFERGLVVAAQWIFGLFYLLLYIIDSRCAHLMISLFEEEAVNSYTEYLGLVESGAIADIDAPDLAKRYYKMGTKSKLSDLIRHVRADEQRHSEVNYQFAMRSSDGPTATESSDSVKD